MRRRTFLRATSITGATAAAGVFGILKYPRGANAAGWGAWPADKQDTIIPADRMAQSVLEIHMNGGLNAFDTFYTVPTWGAETQTYVHQFAPGIQVGNPVEPNRDERFDACGFDGEELWEPAQINDANGVGLYLGPWLLPLRRRPDVLSRMRIMVQRHDQVAHEGANPVSFTGDRPGQPRMAGVGTAIQRYFSENPEAGGGLRAAPYSYVLYPGAGFNTFNSLSASAVGFHPGSARPLGVTVDPNSLLTQLLARPSVSDRDAFDHAITYYRQQYENRLRALGLGAATRAPERGNYEFADFARRNSLHLLDILSADLFQPITVPDPAVCGDAMNAVDMPRMQARLAASLLSRPEDTARYVMWIDTGIHSSVNGGHDTHSFHTRFASQNYPHTFEALMEVINNADENENDPGKIDLDRTMVVINTEFGRTPTRQVNAGETGTNHWPWGYVTVFIGGPIRERGCYGAIDYAPGEATDGYANTNYISPAENRLMVLQALGIYPFSSQTFAVGDVRGGVADEVEAAERVRDVYLGLSV